MIKSVTCGGDVHYCGGARREPPKGLEDALLRAITVSCTTSRHVQCAELADVFGYSPAQIRRYCKSVLGETADSMILRLRLERAAGQLAETDRPIASVAAEAGFIAREAFTRAFSTHFGSSPSHFRLNNCGTRLNLPGYALACRRDFQRSIVVRTGSDSWTRFLFDGPILLGRVFSDGSIDWRSNIRRSGSPKKS